ncbi:autophagy protein 13 [Podila horticola]|nr:autophagy protein 13 [Podila horticola]
MHMVPKCEHNFYVKVIQIVILARVTHPEPQAGVTPKKGSLRGVPLIKKTSKWFNLELEDLDIYKDDAKFWRATAITESPPTMLVELMLDTSELSHNQMLVLVDETNRKNRVDIGSSIASTPGQPRTRRNIILESWSLTLGNTPPDPVPEPPVVYKKSIIFFRSLFAYMRLLPAYQLYRRLRKQSHSLKIGFRVSRGQTPEDSMLQEPEIGMEVPLIEGETRPMISEYRFGQVETPVGAFSLKVTYRSNCDFHVDESEAVLSSRFIDMDENYFTPTIVTHSQESVKSRRQSIDNPAQRPLTTVPLSRRPSNDSYNSGNFQEHFTPIPSLRPRRNSAQSLQQKSVDYSSSQSSVSSLGTKMSRRGSSGAPGGLFTPLDQFPSGTPPFSVTHGGHAAVAKHYVDPIMESPPFRLGTPTVFHIFALQVPFLVIVPIPFVSGSTAALNPFSTLVNPSAPFPILIFYEPDPGLATGVVSFRHCSQTRSHWNIGAHNSSISRSIFRSQSLVDVCQE